MSWLTVNNNEFYAILDKHKKRLHCDFCRKKLWFFQKTVRFVIRTKENVWSEYYHVGCLKKMGIVIEKKEKTGKWDDEGTNNLVH